MSSFVYRIFSADESQGKRVFLMMVMGFFAGIFLATFSVASETLFLQNFNPQTDLPVGIVVSGVFGLITTMIFSHFQGRVSYEKLIITFLTITTLMVIALTLAYKYEFNIKVVIFLSFIAEGPFAALLLLIFWGTFNRLFSLKESKEIIGNIDNGALIASILSFFSIPLIVKYLPNTYDLYYISVVGITVNFVSLMIIARIYNLDKETSGENKEEVKRYSYPKLFKNNYTRLMSFFVIVSMISVAFINFSFLNVTSQQFPDPNDLAGFLSLFGGTVVIVSFIIQTFVADRIIGMYGIKVALLVDPILLGILTIGSVFIGTLFGFTATASNFIIFFLVISMSKLFLDSLRGSLDDPAFKLLFLPFSPAVKNDVQSKVQGVVTVFAGLLAGGIMILFNNIKSFNLLTIVIAVIPSAVLWYFVSDRMHRRYRDTLKITLEENKSAVAKGTSDSEANHVILSERIGNSKTPGTLFALNLMERIEPALFEQSIRQLSTSGQEDIREIIEKTSSGASLHDDGRRTPGGMVASETRNLALMALKSQENSELAALDPKQLSRFGKSPNPEERIQVALVLRQILSEDNVFILIELLRDVHPRVKIAAIDTARIKKVQSSWPILVELLGSITYSHHAFSALVAMGEDVLPYLEKAFHRSGQTAEVMLKIARIYSRIWGDEAINLLWEKIDYPDKELLSLILNTFHNHHYQVPEEKMGKIKTLLETSLGYVLWNLAALDELNDIPRNTHIRRALSEEIKDNYDRIYLLLGLMYDPQSVSLVRKNIESGTSEGVTFALELLDIFIDKEIRRLLFPILDENTVQEKLNLLQDDFPREHFDEVQVLKQILNRDYNQINRWTKACALYTINQIPDYEISDSTIAHLFNPDPFLRETAAWLIRSKSLDTYNQLMHRIRYDIRKHLNDLLSESEFKDEVTPRMLLGFEKVIYLQSTDLFKNMPGNLITEFIPSMEMKNMSPGEHLFSRMDLWPYDLFIITRGLIRLNGPENNSRELKPGDSAGEILFPGIDPSSLQAEVEEEGSILVIGSGRLYDLMSKFEQITKIFINVWDEKKTTPAAVTD